MIINEDLNDDIQDNSDDDMTSVTSTNSKKRKRPAWVSKNCSKVNINHNKNGAMCFSIPKTNKTSSAGISTNISQNYESRNAIISLLDDSDDDENQYALNERISRNNNSTCVTRDSDICTFESGSKENSLIEQIVTDDPFFIDDGFSLSITTSNKCNSFGELKGDPKSLPCSEIIPNRGQKNALSATNIESKKNHHAKKAMKIDKKFAAPENSLEISRYLILAQQSNCGDSSHNKVAGISRKHLANHVYEKSHAFSISSQFPKLELWPEKYKPKVESDLFLALNKSVVHKVRSWIISAIAGTQNQLLMLTGPCGVGKSSCVEVLANEIGMNIRRWKSESGPASTSKFKSNGEYL